MINSIAAPCEKELRRVKEFPPQHFIGSEHKEGFAIGSTYFPYHHGRWVLDKAIPPFLFVP
jgi:hypothetical protein